MNWLLNVVVLVQILAALVMIGLVLVQHGKGADMGASFGSGASVSLFGATGSANFLSRSTAVCAAIFFVCTLSLAYFSNSVRPAVRKRTRSHSCLAARGRGWHRGWLTPAPAARRSIWRRMPCSPGMCPRANPCSSSRN